MRFLEPAFFAGCVFQGWGGSASFAVQSHGNSGLEFLLKFSLLLQNQPEDFGKSYAKFAQNFAVQKPLSERVKMPL